MKKLKLIAPILAVALAITGVFALNSSATTVMPALALGATFGNPSNCTNCTVDNDCIPNGSGLRCQCRENGQSAFEQGTSTPCSVVLNKRNP